MIALHKDTISLKPLSRPAERWLGNSEMRFLTGLVSQCERLVVEPLEIGSGDEIAVVHGCPPFSISGFFSACLDRSFSRLHLQSGNVSVSTARRASSDRISETPGGGAQ